MSLFNLKFFGRFEDLSAGNYLSRLKMPESPGGYSLMGLWEKRERMAVESDGMLRLPKRPLAAEKLKKRRSES